MLDYTIKTIRDSAVLSNSYVAGTVLGAESSNPTRIHEFNQLVLLVGFTIGSLTSAQVKVEFSNDGTTYYQETASTVSSGTSTETVMEHSFSSTGNYRIAVPVTDRYIKVSSKGTGTVTDSLLSIIAELGVN